MSKMLTILFALFAVTMVGLAVAGAFISFSSVPFSDMWDGTLQFYSQVQGGDYSVWWSQHNEHRIILARLLFWLDLHYFGGRNIFLIVMNYFLLACLATVFCLFARTVSDKDENANKPVAFCLFLVSWVFLWIQSENILWAFQSQFFLAQLLPLLAFFCFAKATVGDGKLLFSLALLLGVASAGTMANGVLVLPLLFVYSVLMRQSMMKSMLCLLFSFVTISLYFHGYIKPVKHSSPFLTLRDHPLGVFQYVLNYLGSPFYYLARGGAAFGKVAAVLSSTFLIVGSFFLFVKQCRKKDKSPFVFALVLFIAYIVLTAIITAGGRFLFGLDQAFASRYTTPALMAYAALFIVFRSRFCTLNSKVMQVLFSVVLLALCFLMMTQQLKALQPHNYILEDRKVAALAFSLRIKDDEYLSRIVEDVPAAFAYSQVAIDHNYSIFSHYPYHDLRESMGKRVALIPENVCVGQLTRVTAIPEGAGYYRVEGWIVDPKSKIAPRRINFAQKDVSIGYALTGTYRVNTEKMPYKKIKNAGFIGYAKLNKHGNTLIAIADHPGCTISFDLAAFHVNKKA
jgi:hypothetical protein